MVLASLSFLLRFTLSRFDTALLYQSILMTIVQLFLLELCVRYYPWTIQLPVPVTHSIPSSRLHDRVGSPALGNSSNAGSGSSAQVGAGGVNTVTSRASRHGTGWYREHAIYWGAHFWNWPTIGPYFLFLAVFTLVIGLSLLIIGNTPFYVALLGLAVSPSLINLGCKYFLNVILVAESDSIHLFL